MYSTSWLFDPFPVGRFIDEIWQTEPRVVVTGRPDHFDGFFDSAALERLIEYGQPGPNSIRLAATTGVQRRDVPRLASGRIDLANLRKCYADGETVVLNNIEDFDPHIARLVQAMETELCARTQTNCYITPPNGQGFKPHYDTHDVLVAQIEGRKLWKIYGRDSVCPLNELVDGDPKRRSSAEPATELWLEQGDLLYIPRGWIHEASTARVASLHLTFGIHPPLGCDLLSAALECLVRLHPELREPLPLGFTRSEALMPRIEAMFDRLAGLYHERASASDAVQVITDGLLRRGRGGGDGHLFCDMNRLDGISPKSELERRPNIAAQLLPIEQGVGLRFLNSLVQGPSEFEPAMRFVIEQDKKFLIGDLPALEPDHQLALGRSLVRDGLCRITTLEWQ